MMDTLISETRSPLKVALFKCWLSHYVILCHLALTFNDPSGANGILRGSAQLVIQYKWPSPFLTKISKVIMMPPVPSNRNTVDMVL